MRVVIYNILDISEWVLNVGVSAANFDSTNFILPDRDIILSDSAGLFSPFSDEGIFSSSRNAWRNLEVNVYDDSDILEYSGLIQDIEQSTDGGETIITLKTANTLGALLQFNIEENDKVTNQGFVVDGIHGNGTKNIKIKTGTSDIGAVSVVSFDTDLVPLYQIMEANGSPTVSILLDRGIEEDLADETPLVISIPRVDTPANLLKRALVVALAKIEQSERLDEDSFDELIAEQTTEGLYIWCFVRKEDNISLSNHISTLMTMGDLLLVDIDGKITLKNGFQWDGTNPINELTESEIIEPVSITKDTSRAIYAYNCLWKNGTVIENKTKQIDESDPAIADSLATKTWTPIQPKASTVIGHNYLFGDETTAEAQGDAKLNYYKYSRTQVTCSLSYHYSNGNRIMLNQFDKFLLTLDDYTDEPVMVLSYEFNDNDLRYDSVVLELINNPTPGLTKTL